MGGEKTRVCRACLASDVLADWESHLRPNQPSHGGPLRSLIVVSPTPRTHSSSFY